LELLKENGIPYYKQIAETIKRYIVEGVYETNQKIPTELEMSSMFKVNRHTVRQAITELTNEGVLSKVRGVGTFVSDSRNVIDYKVSNRTSFSENILKLGLKPKAKILKTQEMEADEKIAQYLNIEPGDKVYMLEILRMADEQPAILTTSYLPVATVPGLIHKLGNFKSLYETLEKEYRLKPTRTKSFFKADFPILEDSIALGIPKNQPVLVVESIMKTDEKKVVEYCISRVVSTFCNIVVDFKD
jgi:phosphonate metabolism transcriptional regulator PhnF